MLLCWVSSNFFFYTITINMLMLTSYFSLLEDVKKIKKNFFYLRCLGFFSDKRFSDSVPLIVLARKVSGS